MPETVLYGIISFLGLAIIALGSVWVRSHDNHRQWAVQKINDHEKVIAVLSETNRNIEKSMVEIKVALTKHLEVEEQFQRDLLTFIKKA